MANTDESAPTTPHSPIESPKSHDSYTGHVEPGGSSAVRDLGIAVIRKASVGSMDNNAYLITCAATGAQMLIDAAADPSRLMTLIEEGAGADHADGSERAGQLETIVTTHRHHDHVGALADIAERTGASTAAGEADADSLPVTPDQRLQHGDQVQVGEVTLEVIALRGHTPGSIALLLEVPDTAAHVFTGDSLFPGGVGKTTSPEDFKQLIDDVEQRVFKRLNDDTWVHPGHGDDTTTGAERPHLPQWRDRGW